MYAKMFTCILCTAFWAFGASAYASGTGPYEGFCNTHVYGESLANTISRQSSIYLVQVLEPDAAMTAPIDKHRFATLASLKVIDVLLGQPGPDVIKQPAYYVGPELWQKTRDIYLRIDLDQIFRGNFIVGNQPFLSLVFDGECGSVPMLIPGEYYIVMPKPSYSASSFILLSSLNDPAIGLVRAAIRSAKQ